MKHGGTIAKLSSVTGVGLIAVALVSCAWVKLTPQGEKVRVLDAQEVSSCKQLGSTTVTLKAKVGPYERSEQTVKEEFVILGRNSAVDIGGDTIVFNKRVGYGKQIFDVYKCVNPAA